MQSQALGKNLNDASAQQQNKIDEKSLIMGIR
jgi:hypothetical protein